jgi:hypothetical protein
MTAVRYTVGVRFTDRAVADRWLTWLRNGHIADVIAGGATHAIVYRLDDDAIDYEVVYRFPTRCAYQNYEQQFAQRLREEGRQLFPPGPDIVYRRSTAETVFQTGESQ